MHSVLDAIRRQLAFSSHRIHTLPVLVLMPHSACNCRCVMCDIWKANAAQRELTPADLEPHMADIRRLKVRWVTLSGGEALMHANLWTLCDQLRDAGVRRITLLSTGLLLDRYVRSIVEHCDEVIVSLDGSREIHDRIRSVPRAYDRLAQGVAALKAEAPHFRVTARSVVQKLNYRDLPNIVQVAHELRLDQVSFLAVDVSTTAFNRQVPADKARGGGLALDAGDLPAFRQVLADLVADRADDFGQGFIAEHPDKLWRIYHYFAGLLAQEEFPENKCNAPWVSAVVEADGTVRPCFFHSALGNIHAQPLHSILNSESAIQFRRTLDVKTDPICRRCVCTLNLGPRAPV